LVCLFVCQLVGHLVGWSVGWLRFLLHCRGVFRCAAATANAALLPSWPPPLPSWSLPPHCSWDNYFVRDFSFFGRSYKV
jgi:hypothetical protein